MEFLELWWEKPISKLFWSFWWWFGSPRTVPEQKVKNRFFDFFEILTETKLPMKNSWGRRSGRRQTCQTTKKTKTIITTFKNGSGMISVALIETYGYPGTNISKIQISTEILVYFGTIVKKNCYIIVDSDWFTQSQCVYPLVGVQRNLKNKISRMTKVYKASML